MWAPPWLLPYHTSILKKKFVIADSGDGVPEVPFPFALSWFHVPLPGTLAFFTSSLSPQVCSPALLLSPWPGRAGPAEGRRHQGPGQVPGRLAQGRLLGHWQGRHLPQQLCHPHFQVCPFCSQATEVGSPRPGVICGLHQ